MYLSRKTVSARALSLPHLPSVVLHTIAVQCSWDSVHVEQLSVLKADVGLIYRNTFLIQLNKIIKGTVPQNFRLLVFFTYQFPPSLWVPYPIRAVSHFFENSRRYLQLKVHHRCHWHRWQMEIFNQKSLNHFVWTPLRCRVKMVTLKCKPSDFVLIICHRCIWYRWCWLANRSVNFRKIRNGTHFFSGAWGRMIHEKNLKQKILWHWI